MKPTIFILAAIATCTSCATIDSSLDNTESKIIEYDKIIPYPLDSINSLYESLTSYMTADFNSRNGLSTTDIPKFENAIAQSCSKLVVSGQELQNVVLENADIACIDQIEYLQITSMTDDQLALSSLAYTALVNYIIENAEFDLDGNIRLGAISSSNRYVNCLIEVLGINDGIKLLGTVCELIGGAYSAISITGKTYLTAAEAKVFKKFLVKMAQKYAGWLGVFVILYDYANCLD